MTAIDRTLTQPGTQVVLAARGLEVTFGQTHALRGVDLDIAAGEVLAIMGAIGFGKIDAAARTRRCLGTGRRNRGLLGSRYHQPR